MPAQSHRSASASAPAVDVAVGGVLELLAARGLTFDATELVLNLVYDVYSTRRSVWVPLKPEDVGTVLRRGKRVRVRLVSEWLDLSHAPGDQPGRA